MVITRVAARVLYKVFALTSCVLAFALPGTGHAQTYPTRAVRIVVGYPPGGPTDLIARVVAQRLGESTKQQFIIDNRGGANGIIGTEIVVRSQPDGHTLLFGTSSLASNGSVYRKLPYDAAKDLAPVVLTASTPYFLVVNAALPAASVKDLIALAKVRSGEINFGSAGNGAGTHLAGEMFNVMAGVKLVHVPYKGTGPSVTDLVAGRVEVMFVGLPSIIQQVKAGRLRLLAVAEPKRSPLMPELPTIADAGLPGFQCSAWFGFFGPAGITRDLRRRIAKEIVNVIESKDVQERMLALGAVPLSSTPEQFDAYFREEVARYARVIKEANVRVE
jgi:tripartite-type tricarboxylate transporter receptor subunit TctC